MRILRPFILFIIFLAIHFQSFPQTNKTPQPDSRMDWWCDARFGMFIHWGLYAVPAGEWIGKTGYGEWIRTSAEIPLETYNQFVPQFNPILFDADAWVKMAKEAGMKYIVITSKHHDGFCMFGTQQTGFCITSTPYNKDPMKDLAAACKKYGLKFCFYYSIMDWHHPDYLPRRNWETDRPTEGADFNRYLEYMKAELKELLTNYGEIGVLWFDGEWENTWNEKYGKQIYAYCRSLQPNIIINNRVGAGRLDMEGLTKEGAFGGDFGTPEQQIPPTGLPGVDWETCMTMNDHWGYNKNDKNFKSSAEMIRMLADIASKGGNYLLNVGPKADGQFPRESIDRLREIGKWMSVNGEAIYGTTASPLSRTDWGRCTRKDYEGGVKLFLHVFQWPENKEIIVPGCLNPVKKAYLLSDPSRSPMAVKRMEEAILITLPEKMPDTVNTVIALDLEGKLDLTNPPVIQSNFDILVDSMTVSLETDRENVKIRYTLDGSEPSYGSAVYKSPFVIYQSTVISAKCFREGKPVSGTSVKELRKVDPLPATVVEKPQRGLIYKYYEGDWDSIPVFLMSGVKSMGPVENFSFMDRKQEDHFGYVYEGFILIPASDVYAFYTASDDGSKLYIDDRLVVNNDGLHGLTEKEGVIALATGLHKLKVEYFEKTGSNELQVLWRRNNIKKEEISSYMLYN
jgi:alpha-L-fucosidase